MNGEMIRAHPKQSHYENPPLKTPTGETMLIEWVSYLGISKIFFAAGSSPLEYILRYVRSG